VLFVFTLVFEVEVEVDNSFGVIWRLSEFEFCLEFTTDFGVEFNSVLVSSSKSIFTIEFEVGVEWLVIRFEFKCTIELEDVEDVDVEVVEDVEDVEGDVGEVDFKEIPFPGTFEINIGLVGVKAELKDSEEGDCRVFWE